MTDEGREKEYIASCPKCKTLETLMFVGGDLVPMLKFVQRNGRVYHDCGAEEPCRLFPRFKSRSIRGADNARRP